MQTVLAAQQCMELGSKNYLFKVPDIETNDWIDNPYISPADMTIYSASMAEYFRKNKFTESDNACKIENCNKKSLSSNVLCKEHFIESLQKAGLLPHPIFNEFKYFESRIKK